jgi:hypothetical protein
MAMFFEPREGQGNWHAKAMFVQSIKSAERSDAAEGKSYLAVEQVSRLAP